MTNSIGDILDYKNLNTPDEIAIIKRYVKSKFNSNCLIRMNSRTIIITVDSSSLASSLRLSLNDLKNKLPKSGRQLVIRIE